MDYDWIEMMNYMQNLRQFCSRNVRRTGKGSISTSQELDLLSRISLSDAPLTPHELCSCMGLGKSAVSRVIEHLEKKELLIKKPNLADKRSYLLSITEEGQKALEETYEYYLSPIYTMRRKLGEAHFMELMKLIHETNDVLQDRKH
nr:MarR family transcriptional regulator [uncultured Faecalimonas sp.]